MQPATRFPVRRFLNASLALGVSCLFAALPPAQAAGSALASRSAAPAHRVAPAFLRSVARFPVAKTLPLALSPAHAAPFFLPRAPGAFKAALRATNASSPATLAASAAPLSAAPVATSARVQAISKTQSRSSSLPSALASSAADAAQGLRQDPSGLKASASLDSLYAGQTRKDAFSIPGPSAERGAASFALRREDVPPGSASSDVPAPAAPPSVKRSFINGIQVYFTYLSRGINIAIPLALLYLWLVGDVPPGNYHIPFVSDAPSVLEIGRLFLLAVVMAPVVEEILFRGILLGGLIAGVSLLSRGARRSWARLRGKSAAELKPLSPRWEKIGRLARFWIPTLATSLLFVVIHETANPLFIGMRIAGAIGLSAAFYKEGLLAGMFAHAANNFAAICMFSMALLLPLPLTGVLPMVHFRLTLGHLIGWLALGFAITFGVRWAKKEKTSWKTSPVSQHWLTPKTSFILSAVAAFFFVFFMIWKPGGLFRMAWTGVPALSMLLYGLWLRKHPVKPLSAGEPAPAPAGPAILPPAPEIAFDSEPSAKGIAPLDRLADGASKAGISRGLLPILLLALGLLGTRPSLFPAVPLLGWALYLASLAAAAAGLALFFGKREGQIRFLNEVEKKRTSLLLIPGVREAGAVLDKTGRKHYVLLKLDYLDSRNEDAVPEKVAGYPVKVQIVPSQP